MDMEFVRDTLLRGVETRSVEFKRSLDFTLKATKAKIAKGCMGLANTRDGGFLIVGMESQQGDKHVPVGMDAGHLKAYTQDNVAQAVMIYAEPSVHLTVEPCEFSSEPPLAGKTFVVIEVVEFSDVPIICKKAHQDEGLVDGGVYIRSLDGYGTRLIKSEAEMRDLLGIATVKRLKDLIQTLDRAGAAIVPAGKVSPSDTDAFDKQAEELSG